MTNRNICEKYIKKVVKNEGKHSIFKRIARSNEIFGRQIEAATSISGLVVEIDHLIKDKLSPVQYSKAIQEMKDDPIVIENLSQIIRSVQTWCDDIRGYLPNARKTINNVEVVDYDGR